MKFYAQLNENKICIGISQLSGEVINDNMIEIQSADNSYLWKKYENKTWSTGTFEPESTAPITEYEELKTRVSCMEACAADPAIILSTVFSVIDSVTAIDTRVKALEV